VRSAEQFVLSVGAQGTVVEPRPTTAWHKVSVACRARTVLA